MESLRGCGGPPSAILTQFLRRARICICDKVPGVFPVQVHSENSLNHSSWLLFSIFRHLYDLLLTSTMNSFMKGLSLQSMLSADCPAQSIKEGLLCRMLCQLLLSPQPFTGWASPAEMICGQHPSTVTLALGSPQHPLHLALETQGYMQTNASKSPCKGKNCHTPSNGGTSFIHNHNEKWEIYSISKWVRRVNTCLNGTELKWIVWSPVIGFHPLLFPSFFAHLGRAFVFWEPNCNHVPSGQARLWLLQWSSWVGLPLIWIKHNLFSVICFSYSVLLLDPGLLTALQTVFSHGTVRISAPHPSPRVNIL